MQHSQEILLCIHQNKKNRFENELEFMKNTSNNHDLENTDSEDRITLLGQIIQNLEEPTANTDIKETYFNKIDKYIYKKPWNKLQPFHRVIKMEEYIDKMYSDKPYVLKLKKELIRLINKNKLSTKKCVLYDPQSEQITQILSLEILDNGYKIKG
jgi:hypothetical protein